MMQKRLVQSLISIVIITLLYTVVTTVLFLNNPAHSTLTIYFISSLFDILFMSILFVGIYALIVDRLQVKNPILKGIMYGFILGIMAFVYYQMPQINNTLLGILYPQGNSFLSGLIPTDEYIVRQVFLFFRNIALSTMAGAIVGRLIKSK